MPYFELYVCLHGHQPGNKVHATGPFDPDVAGIVPGSWAPEAGIRRLPLKYGRCEKPIKIIVEDSQGICTLPLCI